LRRRASRGFALLAVIVVVAAAILVATGALFTAQAATANASASAGEARLRGAALDGVHLMAERLQSARGAILAGATPEVAEELLSMRDGAETIEVRLALLPSGSYVESEGAKLDLARAPREAVRRLFDGGSPEREALVEAIAAEAAGGRLSSLDGAAALVAPSERARALRELLGELRIVGGSPGRADELRPSAEWPVVSLATVHAQEALVAADGSQRIDLVTLFPPDASGRPQGAPIASLEEFSETEREVFRSVVRAARGAADDTRLAKALLARGATPERIAAILDRVTTHEGARAPARLDVLRAPREVLESLPGLGPDAAARIEDLRDTLDESERAGTAWLVERRILGAEAYAEIAARIVARSTAWRFRVEASVVQEDGAAATRVAAFDCIVDVGAEEPRIVFLRDVSMLETARILARAEAAREADEGGAAERSDTPAPPANPPQTEVPRIATQSQRATMGGPARSPAAASPERGAVGRTRVGPTGRDVRRASDG